MMALWLYSAQETRNSFLIARDAIESAMAMQYVMLNDIHSRLVNEGLPVMNFRIGIDMGEVLIFQNRDE